MIRSLPDRGRVIGAYDGCREVVPSYIWAHSLMLRTTTLIRSFIPTRLGCPCRSKWSSRDLAAPTKRWSSLTSLNTRVSLLAENPPYPPTLMSMMRKVTHRMVMSSLRTNLPNEKYPTSHSQNCFGASLSFKFGMGPHS